MNSDLLSMYDLPTRTMISSEKANLYVIEIGDFGDQLNQCRVILED